MIWTTKGDFLVQYVDTCACIHRSYIVHVYLHVLSVNLHNVLGSRYIVSTYPIRAHNNPCNSTLYNNVILRLLEFHSINLYGDAVLLAAATVALLGRCLLMCVVVLAGQGALLTLFEHHGKYSACGSELRCPTAQSSYGVANSPS